MCLPACALSHQVPFVLFILLIMSPYDKAGRIPKQSFLVSHPRILHKLLSASPIDWWVFPKISTLVLFSLCLISACARFYIRIHIQKQFAIEDGILLFGISCLTSAMAVLFPMINKMYLVGAAEVEMPGLVLPPDFLPQAWEFEKLAAVALILTWCSIVSVKFSYLFLFKKLISRMRPMIIYWWFATVFNAIISAYGATVYIAACPYFYSSKSRKWGPVWWVTRLLPNDCSLHQVTCAFGSQVRRSIALSVSQMILDIIGDLLSK